MFRQTSMRVKWIGVYLLLLFASTLVILGMIINMHNRDCSEQVILKTYALIKSMTNGNPNEQQKLLSQLIQDDEIRFQHYSRNGLRDLPNFADNLSNERVARSTLNRLSSKLNAIQENNYIGADLQQVKLNEETVQVDDRLQKVPPKKEEKIAAKNDIHELPPKKKLDLSDGLRNFDIDPNDSPVREFKVIPPMEMVKASLRKSLARHINQDELTQIRERLAASGLTFNRTVTTLIQGDTEEQSEIRRRELLGKMDAPFESCAVIGNGGVLDRSYCGAEIDAHDFVMRSNQAPVVGFEEDVGTKVHFMTLNGEGTKSLLKCIKTYNNSTCRRIYQSMKTIDKAILWFSKYGVLNQKFTSLLGRHLNSTVTHPSEPLSEELMKFWDITEHPSSGLFLYSIAAPLCKTISLYGFYPYSKLPNGQQTRYHYYEKFFIEDFDMGHDLPKEFKLLMKLNRAGALRLRTKPCF